MSVQLSTALPNLFVSQSQLSFDPTEVGDERFAVVRIGQESSDVPVRVVSGAAQLFQVAVQASPLRFGTEATFVPAPGGTFVHVRYAPKRAGRHVGELIIEAGQATQTIVLSGRTTGLLARLSPQTRPALLPAPRQRALPAPRPDVSVVDDRSTNRSVTAVVITIGVVSLSALAYWGVTHRNVAQQPIPASVAPKITPASLGTVGDGPTRLVTNTPPVSTPRPTQPAVIPEKKQPLQADVRQEPAEQPSKAPVVAVERDEPVRPAPSRPTLAQQVVAEPTETPAPPTSLPAARPSTQRAVAERAKKRPPKPAESTSDESDLERALNKNQ